VCPKARVTNLMENTRLGAMVSLVLLGISEKHVLRLGLLALWA
jgi:hypothetical protein